MAALTPRPLLFAALLVTAAACSKTVEKETERWDRAQQSVEKLAALYPAFAPALRAQQAKAEAQMATAKAVGDEEARIEAMSTANSLLTAGFVGQLEGVERKTSAVRRKMRETTRGTLSQGLRLSAMQANRNADRLLDEASRRLQEGAQDPEAAKIVMDRVTRDLTAAQRDLDRVARRLRAERAAEKEAAAGAAGAAAAGAAAGSAGKAAPPPPAAPATWSCQYCGRANHGDKLSCEGCGASKASKPAKKKKTTRKSTSTSRSKKKKKTRR